MGLTRVFSKSVLFTFRNRRRFLVFLLIFAIVSSFVAFFVNQVDELQTEYFMDHKGVEVRSLEEFSVQYNQSMTLREDILDQNPGLIESHAMYSYIDLDDSLRIFSVDIEHPWMNRHINPDIMETGRFPKARNEVMVPAGSYQLRNSTNNVTLKSEVVIGQTLTFNVDGEALQFKVVGTFNNDPIQINLNIDTDLWAVMDYRDFEDVVDLYSLDINTEAYAYSLSFTVFGQILLPETYASINELNDNIKATTQGDVDNFYGRWDAQPYSLPSDEAEDDSFVILTSLGYAVLGGIVLSTLFAYLITRFRREEIAILKAMGYSNSSVRTSLLGEIFTTAMSGFIVGLGSVQSILLYGSDFDVQEILRWQAVGGSFIINVVIALPGILLASRRILRVSPAEAFRSG